ncbi:class I SAM-dependent methyltransferase [Ruegeria arenilitoris]|uniref:class I SAM-dependent methyltransferase n=1 Tax=Ruegeria arenilitoris TaxID=1173585 RepID=UPI0014819499|nr:class I SAM-dependent methyltransferase [Ruegeria arenilitoris]
MSTNASGFIGDIPNHYDKGLGPNIFEDYANHLVEACCNETVLSAIELAAGTGIVSRKLRDSLSNECSLVVTDLNGPMLDVAKAKFGAGESVKFLVANAMDLPVESASFDLVVCQFGVMFFPDKVASFREALRVVKPGGRYVFNVWSPMEENPFSKMANDVAASFFPDDPPGFYTVPFHYGDPKVVLADLTNAGWPEVEYETIRLEKLIKDPESFAQALVFGNPLIDEIKERGRVSPEEVAKKMLASIHRSFGATDMKMPLSATTFVCHKHGA